MAKLDTRKTSEDAEVSAKPVRFLRRPEVCALTGLSTSSLYDAMQRDEFPRPIRIGKRLVAWPENEIAAWQAKRIEDARR